MVAKTKSLFSPETKLKRLFFVFAMPLMRLFVLSVPGQETKIYQVGEWSKPVTKLGPTLGKATFSNSGSLLASCFDPGTISLVDTRSNDTGLRLTAPIMLTPWQCEFTANDERIVFLAPETAAICSWNLKEIRAQLKYWNLDFEHLNILPTRQMDYPSESTHYSNPNLSDESWLVMDQDQDEIQKLMREFHSNNRINRISRARGTLEKMRRLDPNDPHIADLLAWYLSRNPKASADELRSASDLNQQALLWQPNSIMTRDTKAMLAYRQGKYADAESLLLQLLQQVDPHFTAPYGYLLTLVDLKLGHWRSALTHAMEAIRSHGSYMPLDREAWLRLAEVLFEVPRVMGKRFQLQPLFRW